MEALVRPLSARDAEPRLLIEWSPPARMPSWAGSLVFHALGLAVLLSAPRVLIEPRPFPQAPVLTPLVAPPRELTQTKPNRGEVGHEFSLENLVPHPRIQAPAGLPPMVRKPPAPLPEPPKIEAAPPLAAEAPPLGSPAAPQAPPPPIQTGEKPKLAFEVPGAASGPAKPRGLGPPAIAPPSRSIMEAVRGAIHQGGRLVVGDTDLEGAGGPGPGLNVAPAPGKAASALEMVSDPMGVDFRPYLIRILAAVKRNWLAVVPESARLGRAGRVQLQLIINRDGRVPKLVIALPSGTDAFDRAAVAGISSSLPFPPLPDEFRGNEIRLQFTFLYNVK